MRTITKGNCCWNCEYGLIECLYCDDPYVVRCCADASIIEQRPQHPPFEHPEAGTKEYAAYDKILTKYFARVEQWEKVRPTVDYGDVCGDYSLGLDR